MSESNTRILKRAASVVSPTTTTDTALFFPSGERRMDLERESRLSLAVKRLRIDSPAFYQNGAKLGMAADEPAANEALLALAKGDDGRVDYGMYYRANRMLRQLTFERELRQRRGIGQASAFRGVEQREYGRPLPDFSEMRGIDDEDVEGLHDDDDAMSL